MLHLKCLDLHLHLNVPLMADKCLKNIQNLVNNSSTSNINNNSGLCTFNVWAQMI